MIDGQKQLRLHLLKRYWGFDQFRPGQEQIIEAAAAGKDVLAVLPTGGGKSLTYQIAGLLREGLAVIISPLISLMEDQVKSLQSKGLKAASLHMGVSSREADLIIDKCVSGHIQFLYLSPERIQSQRFKNTLINLPIGLVAVDEAHCISQWGHDFRPAYLALGNLRAELAAIPWMTLTGTASKRVQDEIIEKCALREPLRSISSIYRPNLHLYVEKTDAKINYIQRVLRSSPGSFLVYARGRMATEYFSHQLNSLGIRAGHYHAGMTIDSRKKNQAAWIEERLSGLVATTAFGMGIDKGNVRHIFHVDLPDSLEAYVQEFGRAGRDGRPAQVHMLYEAKDKERIIAQWKNEFPAEKDIRKIYKKLAIYLGEGIGETIPKAYPFEIEQFAEYVKMPIARVYGALRQLDRHQYIFWMDSNYQPPSVRMLLGKEDYYQNDNLSTNEQKLIQSLLRLYEGILITTVPININNLSEKAGLSIPQVKKSLQALHQKNELVYHEATQLPTIQFAATRIHSNWLALQPELYGILKKHKWSQIEQVLEYIQQIGCRWRFIQQYFDEEVSGTCGHCDICFGMPSAGENLTDKLLSMLNEHPKKLAQIIDQVDRQERPLAIELLQNWLAERKIQMDRDQRIWIKPQG